MSNNKQSKRKEVTENILGFGIFLMMIIMVVGSILWVIK